LRSLLPNPDCITSSRKAAALEHIAEGALRKRDSEWPKVLLDIGQFMHGVYEYSEEGREAKRLREVWESVVTLKSLVGAFNTGRCCPNLLPILEVFG